MGVPKFYRWVSERYPCLSQVVSESQVPEFDNLYLDMNGIIHCCSHPNDDDVMFRISEEQIFADVCAYIDMLFKIIRPKRVFFMAIDGVAPRAKMNQQRARRFMSARNAEHALAKAVRDGVEIPEGNRFDSNCITPGTHFMVALHKHLDNWVRHKIETDPLWRQDGKIRVILSGHDCPGEGEHKIMDFIRAERILPEYDPNTRHCMYGLDADLMMLGLSSHEPHFSLLREEVKFGKVPSPKSKRGQEAAKRKEPKIVNFHLLHLQLFREYLEREFQSLKTKLQFPFDLESVIDDWVLMGFLIGNDFIPHLPNVHIHSDALPLLYKTYIEILPTLDGYLNEKGILNIQRFEKFLKAFSETDRKSFLERLDNEEYLESKTGRPVSTSKANAKASKDNQEELVAFADSDMSSASEDEEGQDSSNAAFISSDEEEASSNQSQEAPVSGGILSAEDALNAESSNMLQDEEYDPYEEEFQEKLKALEMKDMSDSEFENNVEKCWSTTINNAFKRHRKQYYKDKMKYGNISKNELKAQAEGYIRALQWNLHYYYHGCVSWNWYYPFHYSPFISDLVNFHEVDMNFELSTPFRPFEQLLAVLPAASAECLPYHLQQLMKDPNSPIHDFYPTDFDTDLNGKVNDWEAVVLVPFINQKRLLEAINSKENLLTGEEKARNTHGPHILYTCDMSQPDGKRAIRAIVDKDAFRIDKSKVIHGLLSGVKLDVHFSGFPTMCHIPHTANLDYAGVKVFNTGKSKKESILLKPEQRKELERPLETIAEELVNKQVYIDWPMLSLALVAEIWTLKERYVLKDGKIEKEELDLDEQNDFKSWAGDIREHQMNRYAIDLGPVGVIVFCRRFLGLSVTVQEGVLKRQKQWGSNIPNEMSRVAIQVVVSNVNIEENRMLSDMSIEEAYAVNSKVFVMQPQWDGFAHPAIVDKVENPGKPECRVVVRVNIYKGAEIREVRQNRNRSSLHWFNSFEAGKGSGVATKLLTRLTGTIYLIIGSREQYEERSNTTPRFNIGLNLKLTKQNKEVPDYSRRSQANGYWEFSIQAVQLLMEYRNKFRDLITYLEKADETNEVYFAEDVWPKEEVREKQINALKTYLKEIPTASIEKIECGSQYLDSQCIAALEKALPKNDPKEIPTKKRSSVNPAVLYRYALMDGKVLPDPEADFRLFDRVAHVVEGGTVPCGMHGTIIGLIDNKLEVLFDRPFNGGDKIRSLLPQCYCVPKSQVINITFGKERKGKEEKPKKPSQKVIETTSGPYTKWTPKMKTQDSTAKMTDFVPRILKNKATPKPYQNLNAAEKKTQIASQVEEKPAQKQTIVAAEGISFDAKKVELELTQMLGIGSNNSKPNPSPPQEKDAIASLSFLQKDVWPKIETEKEPEKEIKTEASSSAEKVDIEENDENKEDDSDGVWQEVMPSSGNGENLETTFNHGERGAFNSQPPRQFFQRGRGNFARGGTDFHNFRGGRHASNFVQPHFQQTYFDGSTQFNKRGAGYFFGNSSTGSRGYQRGKGWNMGRGRKQEEKLLENSDLVPSVVSRPRVTRGRGAAQAPRPEKAEGQKEESKVEHKEPLASNTTPKESEAPTLSNKPRKSRLAANLSSS